MHAPDHSRLVETFLFCCFSQREDLCETAPTSFRHSGGRVIRPYLCFLRKVQILALYRARFPAVTSEGSEMSPSIWEVPEGQNGEFNQRVLKWI